MEKICVAVRVRPPKAEDGGAHTTIWKWKAEDNRISLHKLIGTPISSSSLSFAFDHVFDEGSSNATVYELLTKEVIHAAVQGFNGTAFAYGQTSSGKTFTMNGSEADPGIIHRAVRDVFEMIQAVVDREFLIRVSYMEIYNEEINDLLAVGNQKLQVHESLERGIFVAGLREEIVSNAENVIKLIELGEVNRHFGETNMNARSSRSHTIFRMVIESKGKDADSSGNYCYGDSVRVSVLNLVDLAGSERIAKTGAGGVRLKEGKHINKSLMVLGNVINKLSDGAKHRGHIPYRDSKLTRILQPALGGNAKTSIICTVAPEEVHIEETKGTLQFASRAKRITNCAQVNEILTDAALLKRQKIEIEELRNKLQGSRAEVLEQEVLKLRNEMLKYEQEREKLELELEEERKSHKERDQCIREQQIKIDNLNSLVTFSDSDRMSCQNSGMQFLKEEVSDRTSTCADDIFRSPCFNPAPTAFVVSRSYRSRLSDCSPLPVNFSNVADEDTWLKLNKGYIADLDSLHFTPARKVHSFSASGTTPNDAGDTQAREFQNLRRQLEFVTKEKNELDKKYSGQLQLNDRLMKEKAQLEQEVLFGREIPQKLRETVASCKEIYKEGTLKLKNSVPDEESLAARILSSTTDMGISLFSSLETNLSTAVSDKSFSWDGSKIQEQNKLLLERLHRTAESLALSEKLTIQNKQVANQTCGSNYKDSTMGGESTFCKTNLSNELNSLKDKCHGLEEELDLTNQLLGASRDKYRILEEDLLRLRKDKDLLHETVLQSSQKVTLVTEQKENIQKGLIAESQRRRYLEDDIKRFSVAFANRQKSLASFHSELRATIEKFTSENTATLSKSIGY